MKKKNPWLGQPNFYLRRFGLFLFLFSFFPFFKIDSNISLIWMIYIIDKLVGHTNCNLFHLDLYHWWFQQILQETHSSCWQNPKSSISTIWSNPFILLENPKKPNKYIMPNPIYLVGKIQEHNKHIKNQLLHGTIKNPLLHGIIKSPLLHGTIRSLFMHGTTKSPLLHDTFKS